MAQVCFYLLEQEQVAGQVATLVAACQLAADCFSNKQKISILCEDKKQAEAIDELLWQLPVTRFIPHNLNGEGPNNGTPVEICWQQASSYNRAVLINLQQAMPDTASQFRQVYDFVPAEEQQKQQARERYKHYRAAGFQLQTQPAQALIEKHDG